MLRRLAPLLVLLTACGPEDPPVDEAGTTEDTDTADPTESVPTTTDDPVAELVGILQGIISVGLGSIELHESRLPCVIPALQEAVAALGETTGSLAGTLEAQDKFVAFITGDL